MKHRPTKRAVVSIVISVIVVAIVVAAMTFAVTRDTGGADAYTVNGKSVSQATINQELKGWAASGLPTTSDGGPISTSGGAVTADFSALWLTNRIGSVAIENLLRKNGVSMTSAERTAARDTLPKAFGKVPKTGQDAYITVALGGSKLANALGGDNVSSKAIGREMRRLDVSVDPKYGRWVRARAEVCPVTGCPAASSTSSSGG